MIIQTDTIRHRPKQHKHQHQQPQQQYQPMHKVVAFYSGFIIHCESSLRALDRRELSDDAEHER